MSQQEPVGAPRRARRSDAARNARILIAAARELFAEHGAEVALDEVARRAGVGNATLYRHFPTRGDLLVAVYADEVDALCRHGDELLRRRSASEALFRWLERFAVHVATKRPLALAATEGGEQRRSELFDAWHERMRATARGLLVRAQQAGAVRFDLAEEDVLALTSALAVTAADPDHARRLMRILRHGFVGEGAAPPEA